MCPPAGVARRLAAAIYDLLLLAALWMVSTFAIVIARGGTAVPPGNAAYQLLLAAITALFFIGFWVRGGQTLGMRAWRLRVESRDGAPLTIARATGRMLAAALTLLPLGAGLWWQWLDREGLAGYDRLAGTRVIVLPPPGRD